MYMKCIGKPALRFSIAMCTYNGARYLPEQLRSFLDQQRAPDEVVICDDGSSDATFTLLESFAREAPFPVRLYRNAERLGYSRNFMTSIALCDGDIIVLSDQDDIWYAQKLRCLEEQFASHPETGGVFSDGDIIDTNSDRLPGTLWGSFRFLAEDQRRLVAGEAVPVLLQRNVVTGMAFAFRNCWRPVLSRMPDHWPHDFWLALMLAADGHLLPCPERLVGYRVHQQQQIGVPITRTEKLAYLRRNGVGAYLELSRQRNLREYSKDALQFESLLAQAQQDPKLAAAWWLPMAQKKAEHMRRVVWQLQAGRVRRWSSAVRHWRGYRSYAPTGLSALLRDLLL